MPVQFSCPECKAVLKSAKPIPAGKQLTCPKCGVLFLMPDDDAPNDDDEILDATVMSDRDEAHDDDRPRRKPVRRRAAADDEDDYDDEEDDRPRRKKKKFSKKKSGGSGGIVLAIVGGGLAFLAVAAICVLGFVDIPFIPWSAFFRSFANKGSGNENALAFVPADSDFVVGINFDEVQKLSPQLHSQFMEGFRKGAENPDNVVMQAKEALGIEENDIFGHMTFAAKAPPQQQQALVPGMGAMGASLPEGAVAIFRTKAAMNQNMLHRWYSKHNVQARKYNGKVYYKEPSSTSDPTGSWVFLPSDRTIVVMPGTAPEEQWQKIVDSDGQQAALTGPSWELLSQTQSSSLWMVAAVKGDLREQMLRGLKNGTPGVFDLKGLTDALAAVECAGFSLGAQNDQYVFSVQAGCSKASAAKKLKTELENLYSQTVKGFMGQMVIAQLAQRLPKDKAQLLTDLINKVKFRSHGAVATVSLSLPQNTLKETLQDLQQMGSPQRMGRPGRGMPRGGFGRPNMPRGRSGRPGRPGAPPGTPPFGAGR